MGSEYGGWRPASDANENHSQSLPSRRLTRRPEGVNPHPVTVLGLRGGDTRVPAPGVVESRDVAPAVGWQARPPDIRRAVESRPDRMPTSMDQGLRFAAHCIAPVRLAEQAVLSTAPTSLSQSSSSGSPTWKPSLVAARGTSTSCPSWKSRSPRTFCDHSKQNSSVLISPGRSCHARPQAFVSWAGAVPRLSSHRHRRSPALLTIAFLRSRAS